MVAAAQMLTQVLLVLWQVQNRPVRYGIFQILLTATNVALSIGLIVGLSYDWTGRIIAQVIAPLIFGTIALGILIRQRWVRFRVNRAYLRHILRFGVPLIPHIIAMGTITMIDRVMVTNMVGLDATGIYMVAVQVCMVLFLVQDSFNRAWIPWLFEQLKQGEAAAKKRIVLITYIYDGVFLILALLLAALAPWVLNFLVGDAFTGAGVYVFWLALAYAFSAMYKMVTNYLFYLEKTHLLAATTLFAASINVVATYFLILQNGAVGAAQGTALAFLLVFVFTWVLAAKLYKMPWFTFRQLRLEEALS